MNAYLYTMTRDGEVIESHATIKPNRTGEYALAYADDGRRVIVSSRASELHNDSMWSTQPKKGVYIEMLLDELLQRREDYRNRARQTEKRIQTLKECW